MKRLLLSTESRSALIAAVIALVVAAPLSSAAHEGVASAVKVVTGKQGKRGPRGLTGKAGPQGPTGPQGAPGKDAYAPGLYDAKLILPGDTVVVLAGGCGAQLGSVTGGSVVATSGDINDVEVVRDGPADGGREYYAVVTNPSTNHAFVKGVAVCR